MASNSWKEREGGEREAVVARTMAGRVNPRVRSATPRMSRTLCRRSIMKGLSCSLFRKR